MPAKPTLIIALVWIGAILSGCATVSSQPAPLSAQAEPASGQLFWDWSGGSHVGGSGRQVVRFTPQFATGEIVVSFGDRQLYYVTRPGEAISYPIAIPREEDRWQGVTAVSDKKLNPSWTQHRASTIR